MPINGTVYVFWDSDNDPEQRADTYCNCVRSAPAKGPNCQIRCRKIDVRDKNEPGMTYYSGNGTIEVVGVKETNVVRRLKNPSQFCGTIHELVEEMCEA